MYFRFLEHTADVQVECFAETFHGLLEASARALYALALRHVRSDNNEEARSVQVTGVSYEDTLVRWLQELIYLLDVEGFVATTFTFAQDEEGTVSARLGGYRCKTEDRAEEVKSATYHEIQVRETAEGFMARVIFDL
jgi:SHS2 domain-containing protein